MTDIYSVSLVTLDLPSSTIAIVGFLPKWAPLFSHQMIAVEDLYFRDQGYVVVD